jgi:SAM-dependent methyltransferase
MKEENLQVFADYYDLIYLSMKDYEKEAEIIRQIIRNFELKRSMTLLDVGCGTGEHLKYLSSHFTCVGLDINRRMIEEAEKKTEGVRFRVADMVDFNLGEKFDVIICLFSSIGYVESCENLERTLRSFSRHLNDKGVLIVEPWIFKEEFRKNYVSLESREVQDVKLVRMATSKIEDTRWKVTMHYLIGREGVITYSKEIHAMLALSQPEYVQAFEHAGYKVKYVTDELWDNCRGLFIAIK